MIEQINIENSSKLTDNIQEFVAATKIISKNEHENEHVYSLNGMLLHLLNFLSIASFIIFLTRVNNL